MPEKRGQAQGKELRGQVTRLVDLIDYQDQSVVSRQIVNNKAGTVTLFAFDAGQGLSEHTTPFDALVQLLDGEAEITVAGRQMRARAGDMVIMPANHPHSLDAVQRFKMLLTMIKP